VTEGAAADLHVRLGIFLVVHAQADARIATDVPVLATALGRGDDELVAFPAHPDDGGLRTAVRVDRRQHGGVRLVEEPADGVIEADGHGPIVPA